MTKFAIAIAAVLALTACGKTAQQLAIEDDQKCTGFGFEQGTEGYGLCRLQAEQIRIADRQARAAGMSAAAAVQQNVWLQSR